MRLGHGWNSADFALQVCALKLSESQLQAALAAARHRGDAAQQLAAARAASLRAAEDSVEHLAQQQVWRAIKHYPIITVVTLQGRVTCNASSRLNADVG